MYKLINILANFIKKLVNIFSNFIMSFASKLLVCHYNVNPSYTCGYITTEFKQKLIEALTNMEYCDIPPRFPWPPSYWFGVKKTFREFFSLGAVCTGEQLVYAILDWCDEIIALCNTNIIVIPSDHHIRWAIDCVSDQNKGYMFTLR